MKLQQLRYLNEVVRCGFSVSAAAESLHTAQPGISNQIQQLEKELGIQIFDRKGKRLTGLTEPGKVVAEMAERLLQDAEYIKRAAAEFTNEKSGSLSIATTHTQARYALPAVIKTFTLHYPEVRLEIHQGSPTQISEMVVSGAADVAIATEGIALFDELIMMPCYTWNRCIIAPPDHPVLHAAPLTLEKIAEYPIVTYDFAFAGRSKMNRAFEAKGLTPNVVLTAIDSDIIKTYVELGLGIGILAAMAFDPARDLTLRSVDASHLFEASTTHIGLRRGAYLRGYTYKFIELFAPHLTHEVVNKAMQEGEHIAQGLL